MLLSDTDGRRERLHANHARLNAEAKQPPCGCQRIAVTVFLCRWSRQISLACRGSQSLTTLSLEPDASSAFSGCHCTVFTSQPCDLPPSTSVPLSRRSRLARSKSQILTDASSEHEAWPVTGGSGGGGVRHTSEMVS